MDGPEKSERLIEAASAVLDAAPDKQLNAVVLNKTLFYLDLASLRDRGVTVTENPYIALENGPVIAKYPQRLIGQLEVRGIAKQISEWGSKPIVLESPLKEFKYLDAEILKLASAVTAFFANSTSRNASDFSHENPGWELAWNEFRHSGRPAAINLRIALQQIIEDDPWMDLPLFNDEELLAAADSGTGLDW